MGNTSRYCFRDPGALAPRLAFAQSFWALQQRELSIFHSMELCLEAGDTYLEAGLLEERMPVIRQLLEAFPVRLIAQGWATTAGEAQPFLERAANLGACCINFHLGHAYMKTDEAIRLVDEVRCCATAFGLPFLMETHRGRLTQDLLRTTEMLAHSPEIAITLDISHYLVAGEGLGSDAASFMSLTTQLARKTAALHGRISDGQSIQVRSGDPLALTNATARLWREAMTSWLLDAPDDAVFIFEPELGPPPYAQRDAEEVETSSRTAESALLKQIARTEWNAASSYLQRPVA